MDPVATIAVVAVLVVGVGVVWLVSSRAETKRRQQVIHRGDLVIGMLVQANNDLIAPGMMNRSAQVLITFESSRAVPDKVAFLQQLAKRMIALKSATPTDPVERHVTSMVGEEGKTDKLRERLPVEFTGGPVVYSAQVTVERKYLPQGTLTRPWIQCVAVPGDNGAVYMVPYSD